MTDVSRIIQYEQGEMDAQEEIEFFQDLLDSGVAFQLQGSYQRQLQRHIDAGNILSPGSVAPVCQHCGSPMVDRGFGMLCEVGCVHEETQL
jgi:hypothetical protein